MFVGTLVIKKSIRSTPIKSQPVSHPHPLPPSIIPPRKTFMIRSGKVPSKVPVPLQSPVQTPKYTRPNPFNKKFFLQKKGQVSTIN